MKKNMAINYFTKDPWNWKDALLPGELEKLKRCEPDDILLLSNPPQYKCGHCEKTWFTYENRPICNKQNHNQGKGCTLESGDNAELKDRRVTINSNSTLGTWRDSLPTLATSGLSWNDEVIIKDGKQEGMDVLNISTEQYLNLVDKKKPHIQELTNTWSEVESANSVPDYSQECSGASSGEASEVCSNDVVVDTLPNAIDKIIEDEYLEVCKANKDNGVIYVFKQMIKRKIKTKIQETKDFILDEEIDYDTTADDFGDIINEHFGERA
ncbi:MAG: hypothetical protein ACFFG0_10450 [Candidatus Thorarchaeota archaeon]